MRGNMTGLRVRKIGAVLIALLGCFWAFNALMFPKDRWFWSGYHYLPFFLLPACAVLIAFLLYPRSNPSLRDESRN
jgi:hypothetical protein